MEGELINRNYKYPDYYNWPFFFTIQKNAETRLKQFTMWAKVIVEFCKANKIWRISKSQFSNSLGQNVAINRKLTREAIDKIYEYFVQNKYGIFVNQNNRDEIFILWKSLIEWEEFIYAAAAKHHRIETIETLDYLIGDEDNENEEFYGMDKEMLVMILQSLEKSKRCILLCGDNQKYVGVKFLK